MSNARSRRLHVVAAPWLIAFALLVSACGTSVRDSGGKVTTPPPAPSATTAPTAPAAPTLRVAGTGPTNILVPGATVSVVGGPPGEMASQPVRVALLAPLSGKLASIGKSMQDAAQLAVVELAGDGFVLLPFDTQGTPAGATAAAQAAISNDVQLILGPLRSTSTRAVTPIAQAAGVPVISFSSDKRVAGGGTFVMGFLPGSSVDRSVAYTNQRGINRFALLAPDGAYGQLVASSMRTTASSVGAEVSYVEFYDPATMDFAGPVQSIADVRTSGGGTGFDALMIAEASDRLRAIAAYLPASGLDGSGIRLLGTGVWDDRSLSNEPGLHGGWYAVPPPSARTRFIASYQEVYGAQPHRLASLAYDATAMAAVLARSVGPSGFAPAVLASPSGFLGADGLFRFNPNGLVERSLAVMEVTPAGPVVVSPALRTFQTLPAGAAGS